MFIDSHLVGLAYREMAAREGLSLERIGQLRRQADAKMRAELTRMGVSPDAQAV